MNRGKVTPEMRKKWIEQFEYLARNINIFERLNEWEEKFIISIEKDISSKKGLSIHQSFKLNQICNKYQ